MNAGAPPQVGSVMAVVREMLCVEGLKTVKLRLVLTLARNTRSPCEVTIGALLTAGTFELVQRTAPEVESMANSAALTP